MKYELVEAPGVHQLEDMVNEMLEAGWKLQGGLCSTKYGGTAYYAQAMVKHDEVKVNAQGDISRGFEALSTLFGKCN